MNYVEPQDSLSALFIENWGLLEYSAALKRQDQLVSEHLRGEGVDRLVFVQHPKTITLGRRGSKNDLHYPEAFYGQQNISLCRINRGGLATAHEPGQLVAYPIIKLKQKNLKWFAHTFLTVVVRFLAEYGIEGYLKPDEPGVWVNGGKICSFGIGIKRWVSCHGIALNINNDLTAFQTIVPCGKPSEIVTSVKQQLGHDINMDRAYEQFQEYFCQAFDYRVVN